MHVPQGMAYASLAGVPPVYGMYSSFFASTIYMFFGTARHISIGVFAVASMMVGAARLRLAPDIPISNSSDINPSVYPLGEYVDPLVFTSALTLLVGVVQIIMGILRLGFLTTYLSDSLVSGFTTGAAVHVFTSQLNKVFGIKLPRHEGIGMIVRMYRDMIMSLGSVNFVALGISIFGILFLDLGRTYINPIVKKFSPIPPPLELILVIFGIVISMIFNLDAEYHVKTVYEIPRGFPLPSIPRLNFLPALLSDAIPIAVVCYMFVMSMGKLFAKKHKYKTDATQELYAIGIASALSSFFPVYPVGASLSRSSVCEMSGANTQLYTIFSSFLLLTVILLLGPFLEPLPMCILACIVIVSLKSLFMQVKELPRLYRISKYDFAIWLVACLSTIFTDVTTGLVISLAFSLYTLVLRQQWPSFSTVLHDETPRQNVPENVKIVKFAGSLHFANVTAFQDDMGEAIGKLPEEDPLIDERTIILDASSVAFIDIMGVDALRDVFKDALKLGVHVFYCGLPEDVLSVLSNDENFLSVVPPSTFFPSIDSCLISFVHQQSV
ncbi:STAS domain-containing protein [Caenorhabditis elegans]|nr:STAS domain-containing protein [Caenorhabditis elegans]CCA65687.1 STAS domain-containing protein [Caenorhabditis elegans]|eukprot:NP_001256130.1 SULfate Permease family [Caenorhabditis elegans]